MKNTIELDLAAAQADMVLAQDVANETGHVLAAAGMVITDSLLEGLRKRGIERLSVRPQEDAAANAVAQAERIAYLFRKAEGDPLREALRRALEQYRSKVGPTC